MHITLLSPFDPFPRGSSNKNAHVGGVERVLAECSDRLAARGHEVTLICSTDGPAGRSEEAGKHVIRVRRQGTLLRDAVVNLARHMPGDADIVHVPATYPFTTPRALRRAKEMGIPSVLDFHFEPSPGGPIGRLAVDLYRRVGPPSYRLADSTIVRSYAYGRSAPSLAVVPEEQWRTLPNGIDPVRFNAEGEAHEGDYLLFVGRLVPYKGLSVLLHALAQADVGLPLLIVGDGPLREELEATAARLGVDVRFLGHVPDDMLPVLYRGAQLSLLPSVNRQEAFGISLIESMACGTPVVASALPGVKDVASFGGLVAEPGDPTSLAAAIRKALEPGVLERGRALSTRVHDTFSWDAVTERLIEVYDEVLSGREATPRMETNPEVSTTARTGGHTVLRS